MNLFICPWIIFPGAFCYWKDLKMSRTIWRKGASEDIIKVQKVQKVCEMKNIGNSIKILREKMNIPQSLLAEFLGVDQFFVSRIEIGERNVTADMLEKLACLFGVPVDVIESGSAELTDVPAFEVADLTAEDLRSISDINRIAINSEHMTALLDPAKSLR